MSKLNYKIFIIIICGFSLLHSQGTLSNIAFYSASLNEYRQVQIYLPENYNPQDNATRFPVIYFLHGAGENSRSEDKLFSIYNNLLINNIISPVIIVKPDGSCPPWGWSLFTNSELYGQFEAYIVTDLIELIDSAYNTIASRDKRAIMGYSSGGYAAMRSALKHPEIYCGVATHSGALNLHIFSKFASSLLVENGGGLEPVSSFNPSAGPITLGAFRLAGALSPNLDNPPYYVDFPFDSMGYWIPSVWEHWKPQNCASLAKNIDVDDNLAIYFDCGTKDEVHHYEMNTSFADSLDKLGLPHEFQSFDGGHYDRYERYPTGLKFLDSVINKIAGINDNEIQNPLIFSLSQNNPNPFNPKTTIQFPIPVFGFVVLKVYDFLGREVATLVNGYKSAGEYVVEFTAKNISSGIYLYQMKCGNFIKTKKMLLMK